MKPAIATTSHVRWGRATSRSFSWVMRFICSCATDRSASCSSSACSARVSSRGGCSSSERNAEAAAAAPRDSSCFAATSRQRRRPARASSWPGLLSSACLNPKRHSETSVYQRRCAVASVEAGADAIASSSTRRRTAAAASSLAPRCCKKRLSSSRSAVALGKRAAGSLASARRQIRSEQRRSRGRQHRGLRVPRALHHLAQVAAEVGRRRGEHLEQRRAEQVDVGALVHLLRVAGHHLWREIRGRAHQSRGLGRGGRGARARHPSRRGRPRPGLRAARWRASRRGAALRAGARARRRCTPAPAPRCGSRGGRGPRGRGAPRRGSRLRAAARATRRPRRASSPAQEHRRCRGRARRWAPPRGARGCRWCAPRE